MHAVAAVFVGLSCCLAPKPAPPPTATAFVRVNQIGYSNTATATKRAYLMSTTDQAGTSFSVKNGSGAVVGAPALYVVTQEQKHVDGSIDGAQPIADGASADYAVMFPSDLQRDDVGLVVLELGDENYGALAPKVIEGT